MAVWSDTNTLYHNSYTFDYYTILSSFYYSTRVVLELLLPCCQYQISSDPDNPAIMASRGVSILKFVGTVSLGLLTVSDTETFPLVASPRMDLGHRRHRL